MWYYVNVGFTVDHIQYERFRPSNVPDHFVTFHDRFWYLKGHKRSKNVKNTHGTSMQAFMNSERL
jgi:hypothetical protein